MSFAMVSFAMVSFASAVCTNPAPRKSCCPALPARQQLLGFPGYLSELQAHLDVFSTKSCRMMMHGMQVALWEELQLPASWLCSSCTAGGDAAHEARYARGHLLCAAMACILGVLVLCCWPRRSSRSAVCCPCAGCCAAGSMCLQSSRHVERRHLLCVCVWAYACVCVRARALLLPARP